MTIFSLVKIGKREHLDDFRKTGRMRMPQLATFQSMEDDVGRGDRHDGLTAWLQPDQCKATFAGIALEGMIKPIMISHDDTALHHVYCLHAITSLRLPAVLEQQAPAIEPENFKLGTHALIITNVTEFTNRLQTAARSANINLQAGPVEYVDPDTYHGAIGAFRKFRSFAYQSEWRVLVDPTGSDIFWLQLDGGIEDISIVVESDQINANMKFSYRGK